MIRHVVRKANVLLLPTSFLTRVRVFSSAPNTNQRARAFSNTPNTNLRKIAFSNRDFPGKYLIFAGESVQKKNTIKWANARSKYLIDQMASAINSIIQDPSSVSWEWMDEMNQNVHSLVRGCESIRELYWVKYKVDLVWKTMYQLRLYLSK